MLWVQEKVAEKKLEVACVEGKHNRADSGTKILGRETIDYLMGLRGLVKTPGSIANSVCAKLSLAKAACTSTTPALARTLTAVVLAVLSGAGESSCAADACDFLQARPPDGELVADAVPETTTVTSWNALLVMLLVMFSFGVCLGVFLGRLTFRAEVVDFPTGVDAAVSPVFPVGVDAAVSPTRSNARRSASTKRGAKPSQAEPLTPDTTEPPTKRRNVQTQSQTSYTVSFGRAQLRFTPLSAGFHGAWTEESCI
ncbi:unnamed protein product [Polarella glacialis]|uniref:Uncharacterized protein n=1 Tax=Polarella glacialis TaxID=89957 RepID=A0A813E0F1_POLGL|nr:unnamed protein product [Polarella glacialis]